MSGSFTKTKGFTLVELLVVLALLSVVTTIGVTMFFEVSNLWRQTAARTDLAHSAQNALDVIGNDVNQLLSPSRSGVPIKGWQRGFAHTTPDDPYWRIQLENDLLVLPVTYPNYVTGLQDRARIRYALDRTGASHRLIRSVLPLHAEIDGLDAPSVAIADGVVGFRVEFGDGAQWHAEWPPPETTTATPKMVRINLTLHDINRPYEQLSRHAVFPIHVE